ncbi:hypothetical protein, partial [Bifidobacterium adolescentis]|uniref:hypothetical protein n=3 Tax=Bifidobacterium adolescentis TaxID=1680 RepID=UPI001C8C79C0
RTQDAGHALLRQGRNPKVRKNSGVIETGAGYSLLFAGMRVVIRDMGWLATKVETNALGNDMSSGSGVSLLGRDCDALFFDNLCHVGPVDPVRAAVSA